MQVPEQFRLNFNLAPAREAVLRLGSARFTVLTDRLIRLEYDPAGAPDGSCGGFEDRASQTFWFRSQPVPAFTYALSERSLDIETEYLHLHYEAGERGFTPENVSILVKATNTLWHPGDPDEILKGTTRTLDFRNGYTPLGSGLVSRSGWALFDDLSSLVFNDECCFSRARRAKPTGTSSAMGTITKPACAITARSAATFPMIPVDLTRKS